MASVIKLRNIGGVDDKRIQLVNSNFARPFTIPSGWTKLRVGVRMIMLNTGASLTGTPKFYCGLCSGNTNLPLDPTTTHFIGEITTGVATWTYAAGPPVRYSLGSHQGGKRVGTTNTLTAGAIWGSGFIIKADATTANRIMLFVDIATGSPNYTISGMVYTGTATEDVLDTDFLTQVVLPVPAFSGHSYGGTGSTVACNPGVDGVLDHVCVAWDRVNPVIEICDLALVKLA